MNSLNFKDRTNTTDSDTTSTPLDTMFVVRNFNDASQAFRWANTNAQMLLRNRTGVYKRADFETKYGLVYSDQHQTITPP